MTALDDHIAIARRHVDEGRKIVERQRRLIMTGHAPYNAEDVLATFEASQRIFEDDLARLLEEKVRAMSDRLGRRAG